MQTTLTLPTTGVNHTWCRREFVSRGAMIITEQRGARVSDVLKESDRQRWQAGYNLIVLKLDALKMLYKPIKTMQTLDTKLGFTIGKRLRDQHLNSSSDTIQRRDAGKIQHEAPYVFLSLNSAAGGCRRQHMAYSCPSWHRYPRRQKATTFPRSWIARKAAFLRKSCAESSNSEWLHWRHSSGAEIWRMSSAMTAPSVLCTKLVPPLSRNTALSLVKFSPASEFN